MRKRRIVSPYDPSGGLDTCAHVSAGTQFPETPVEKLGTFGPVKSEGENAMTEHGEGIVKGIATEVDVHVHEYCAVGTVITDREPGIHQEKLAPVAPDVQSRSFEELLQEEEEG